jgi:hypothetical protein
VGSGENLVFYHSRWKKKSAVSGISVSAMWHPHMGIAHQIVGKKISEKRDK